MTVVFLDTNCINSKSFENLFGRSSSLKDIMKVADIVIPEMTFEELIIHKRNSFIKKVRELKSNPLRFKVGIDANLLESLSFSSTEEELRNGSDIDFSVCGLCKNSNTLQRLCQMALNNLPPFDEGTDKGFKDAVIALSIDEYIEERKTTYEAETEDYYVVTNDSRLQDYFNDDEYINKDCVRIKKSIDDLLEELNLQAEAKSTNTECREPNNHAIRESSDFQSSLSAVADDLVEQLCLSKSFSETHKTVYQIKNCKKQLSSVQSKKLLKAAVSNNQIGWILSDRDICNFFVPLFNTFQDCLTDAQYALFTDYAKLPNERMDDSGSVLFSSYEREEYNEFIEDLISHIQSRSWLSSIVEDDISIIEKLDTISHVQSLDPAAINWRDVVRAFICGQFEASNVAIDPNTLPDFLAFYNSCNSKKQKAIMTAIRSRLEIVSCTYDEDLPF